MRVVFVYLGGLLPKYAENNLRIFLERFPNLNVVLVSDIDENNKFPEIYFYKFQATSALSHFANSTQNDVNFRNGFWLHTLTRFHAISEYMKTHPFDRILHFELDVWVSDDFPFTLFENLDGEISFSLPSPTEGSAAVLSLRDHFSAEKLINLVDLIAENSPGLTDMLLLREIYDRKLMSMDILPVSPSDPELVNSKFGKFIFDPSSWGMFLLGQDPRNFRGFQVFRRKEDHHYVDPTAYEIETDGRSILVKSESGLFHLANLHVHSKDLRFFKNLRKSRSHLQRYVSIYRGSQKKEFRPSVFMALLSLKIRKEFHRGFGLSK